MEQKISGSVPEKKYGYSELNSMLVLKDILASVWKGRKKSGIGL